MPTRRDPPTNVTSIVSQLQRRQLERMRATAEKLHRRELLAMVEMAETMHKLESPELDSMLDELHGADDPEAADTAARLRCARAMSTCVRGDEAGGHAEWEAVMAENPGMALPYVMRARYWLQNKQQPERALPDLERAVTIEPQDPGAYFWRARCHEALGDNERALANLRRAAALDAEAMDVLHALAQALSEHGDAEEAKAAWNRLIAVAPGYVDFHLGRARFLEKQGAFAEALPDYDRAVELDPDTAVLRYSRAMTMSLAGRVAEAADELQRLADGAPDEPVFLRGLGDLRTRSDRADLALAPLSRAIELDPTAEGFAARGRAHRALGDANAALADFDRAMELDPDDEDTTLERLMLLVKSFPREQMQERVFDEIERLGDRMNDVASVAVLQADVRKARGDHAGALEAFDRAIAMDPDVDGKLYLERAVCHARLDHVQEAFDDATRAIERSPDLVDAYVARAIYRSHLEDDYVGALDDFERAIALAPGHAAAHFHRAELLSAIEEYEDALEDYDAAVAAAPAVGKIHAARAACRGALGDDEGEAADRARAEALGFEIEDDDDEDDDEDEEGDDAD